MNRRLFLVALLALSFPLAAVAGESAAGHVTRLQAEAFVNGQKVVQIGQAVHAGDRIATGPNARLEIRFADDGTLTLGEKAEVAIDGFLFEPKAAKGESLIGVAKGAFLATTGAIAKLNSQAYKVKTPLATIGIRGTTFWGGDLDGGFKVLMLEGKGVVVESELGKVELTEPDQGTGVEPGKAPTTPVFWGGEKRDRAVATVSFR